MSQNGSFKRGSQVSVNNCLQDLSNMKKIFYLFSIARILTSINSNKLFKIVHISTSHLVAWTYLFRNIILSIMFSGYIWSQKKEMGNRLPHQLSPSIIPGIQLVLDGIYLATAKDNSQNENLKIGSFQSNPNFSKLHIHSSNPLYNVLFYYFVLNYLKHKTLYCIKV